MRVMRSNVADHIRDAGRTIGSAIKGEPRVPA